MVMKVANAVQVNWISIENLLVKQYNEDYVEQLYDDKKEMSVEDQQFKNIESSSAEL